MPSKALIPCCELPWGGQPLRGIKADARGLLLEPERRRLRAMQQGSSGCRIVALVCPLAL